MSDQTKTLLNYPYEKKERYGAYVCFFPQAIDGPRIQGNGTIVDNVKGVLKGLTRITRPKDIKDALNDSNSELNEELNSFQGNVLFDKARRRTIFSKGVKIYLPTAFTATDTLTYDSPSIGISGATIEEGLNQARGSVTSVFRRGIENFLKSFDGGGNTELGRLGIARLANRTTNNIGNGTAAALRVTVDPNIRTLFRGVGIRSFQFQFKFIATSRKEAEEVEKIIYRFRYYAYPESIPLAEGISAGLKYPNPFDIHVKYRGKPKINYELNDKDERIPLTRTFHQPKEGYDLQRSEIEHNGMVYVPTGKEVNDENVADELKGEIEKDGSIYEPRYSEEPIVIDGEQQFKRQEEQIIFEDSVNIGPKMKSCYLTNVTTNFNPTTMTFHDDGKPVEIDLSLSFTEQITLNRKDIEEGY